jgi:phytoene desaturase
MKNTIENPTALVIGAGLGGIATAGRLARNGFQVTVLEKNEHPGGRCDRLFIDGHHFDTGPTLFLMPEIYAQTFTDLGERMEDHLELLRIDPTYRISFDDGFSISMTSDLHVMYDQLETMEKGAFGRFLDYIRQAEGYYYLTLSEIIERNFIHFLEYFNPKNLHLLFKLNVLTKHMTQASKYFKDHRLQAALTFQDMYLGISPFDAPATYSLLQYSELAEGVWLPKGGMYRVIEVITQIVERLGVELIYNAPVDKIDIKGEKATGVTLVDGRQFTADIVVANADLPYVYNALLPDDGTSRRLARKQHSFSALTFLWGLDKPFTQFEAHSLFLPNDCQRGFDQIFNDLTLPDHPIIYVHAPTRVDPLLAPSGQDSLIVILPVGHIDEDNPQDWDALLNRARQDVFQRFEEIGVFDLKEHIKFEQTFTPKDWKNRYNLTKGSPHGLSYIIKQVGYLRPHNRHKRYHNLYFVGASTHPGTGLPMVLISARLTTERILQDTKRG